MVKEKVEKKAPEPKDKSKTSKKVDKDTKKTAAKKGAKEVDAKKKAKKTADKKGEKSKAAKKEKVVKAEPLSSVFNKPGQKHITPPKGDGTRGFYESLLEANPKSVIAIVYCVEHGLFGGQKHQELYETYQNLRKEGYLKGGSGGIRPQAIKYLDKPKPSKKRG